MPKASELFAKRPNLDLFIYGDSGSGKTTWSALAPNPFIILTEPQGLPSIVAANGDAEVFLKNTVKEYFTLFSDIKQGKEVKLENGQFAYEFFNSQDNEKIVCQTVVLDSLTQLHNLSAEYLRKTNKEGENVPNWQLIQKTVIGTLDMLRTIPINTIVIGLSNEVIVGDGDSKSRFIRPMLFGKLAQSIGQYFNAVGFAAKSQKDVGKFGIAFNLNSRFITKKAPNFPDHLEVNLDIEGFGTLGSLLLHSLKNCNPAHNETDSAEHITTKE